jgi:Flp pilus assembly secretin CpaC
VNVQYDFFATRHHRDGIGFQAPGQIGSVLRRSQWGELFNAKVDYNVTIANADKQQVEIVARPHLTTLNSQRAEFLAGGEIVFQVSGIESGDIKPYPFGIELNVTPTILRTPGPNGETQVLLDVEASRISVLGRLLTGEGVAGSDDVNFDKTKVKSKTLLGMKETLILSGLYQREYRVRLSGVPILRKIPILNLIFSNKTEVDDVLSTIIFITPREPGKVDQQLQDDIASFVERRVAYIKAKEEGAEAIEKLKEDYPDWYQPQNNRYATHFFLVNNSRVYRELRGEDLRAEELRKDLLGIESAEEAAKKRKQKIDVPL